MSISREEALTQPRAWTAQPAWLPVLFWLGGALAGLVFFVNDWQVLLPWGWIQANPHHGHLMVELQSIVDLMIGGGMVGASFALALIVLWLGLRRASVRASLAGQLSRLPFVRTIFNFYRSGLFCRNLGILLGSGVNLTAALRILVNIMSATGGVAVWTETADRVRHGGKLSEALAATSILPPMAVRMLRLGEETGQLAVLAGRVADFYEAKLQRSLDRIVGIAGPAAIIVISVVVGGLIISVMTALLSVSQIVG